MAQIICPYCLTPQSGRKVTQCQNADCPVGEIPEGYVESVRRTPPIWLTMFGNPQHGKSASVDSMALWIESIGKIIDDADCDYLDDYTQEQVRLMRINDKEGLMKLESTKFKQQGPRPLLIKVNNIVPDREQTLVIYDLPGELTDDVAVAVEYAAAIRYAQTVWFIVSLADLRADHEGRTMSTLLMNYQKAMHKLKAPVEGRSMLVIYTKADRLNRQNGFDLPADVQRYIEEDPYSQLKSARGRDLKRDAPFDMDSYVDQLDEISKQLREFTFDQVDSGSDFIAKVGRAKIKPLAFCMTSALPQADSSDMSMGQIFRIRVLDPLLWTLQNSGEPPPNADATLVIESGAESEEIFASEIHVAVIDALRSLGIAVTPYFTGYSRASSLKGGSEDFKPVSKRLHVIGPILDKLPGDETVILLVKNEPHDLRDYEFSSWAGRLVLITIDGSVADYWDKRIVWESDLDLTDAITSSLQE